MRVLRKRMRWNGMGIRNVPSGKGNPRMVLGIWNGNGRCFGITGNWTGGGTALDGNKQWHSWRIAGIDFAIDSSLAMASKGARDRSEARGMAHAMLAYRASAASCREHEG